MSLLSAAVRLLPAFWPIAMLELPLVRFWRALVPKALLLLLPVALPLSAFAPKAELNWPIVLALSALAPKAALTWPVVLDRSAASPKAELAPPVVLALSVRKPKAELPPPVRFMFPADAPTNVLVLPKLCRNGAPPKVSTPTETDVVLGSARLPPIVPFPLMLKLAAACAVVPFRM